MPSHKSYDSGVPDPSQRSKYLLQVTAGPSYDESTHKIVAVNESTPHIIENDIMTCKLNVRIRDYHGLPLPSPSSSPYFSHPLHLSDRYSISFSFTPKVDIPGNDLITGFDFDHSIRDRLPPGFKTAMRIVTTLLDPGIYADPYSEKPYLYGPALSSFFAFRVGEKKDEALQEQEGMRVGDGCGEKEEREVDAEEEEDIVQEGAVGSGVEIRKKLRLPDTVSKRRRHFLNRKNLDSFVFEKGREYGGDFFNPYLDFANFALRIPGFSLSVVRYIDDKTHQLRFVLKNRSTGEVLFVVIFTLLFGDKLEEALSTASSSSPTSTPSSSTASSTSIPVTSSTEPSTLNDDRPITPPTAVMKKRNDSAHPSPDSDRTTRSQEENEDSSSPAVKGLVTSLYESLPALGFGRRGTPSSSRSDSPAVLEKRIGGDAHAGDAGRRNVTDEIDALERGRVEGFLRGRSVGR